MNLDEILAGRIDKHDSQWRHLFYRGVIETRVTYTDEDLPPYAYVTTIKTPAGGDIILDDIPYLAPNYSTYDPDIKTTDADGNTVRGGYTNRVPVYSTREGGEIVGYTAPLVPIYQEGDPVWVFAPRGDLSKPPIFILSLRYEGLS